MVTGPGELWRLRRLHHTAVCRVEVFENGTATLVLVRDGVTALTEQYVYASRATIRGEDLRLQYLAEGWTGVFDR